MTKDNFDLRAALIRAYDGKCAVTGSQVQMVLDIEPIVLDSQESNASLDRYVLLRIDVQRLFRQHYISFDAEFRVSVSTQLRWSEYWRYQGRLLQAIPQSLQFRPAAELISRHLSLFLAKAVADTGDV